MTDLGRFNVHIQRSNGPGDVEVARLAESQWGVAEHDQLLALGVGRSAIQYRLRTGRLHILFPRVYAVGHPRVERRGRWMAAVLACGPHAVLSHRDAAALWRIRPCNRRQIDVTAPRSRGGHAGIDLHRVRRLHPDDVTRIDNIPVTSLARTLLDLAEVVTPRELRRALEEAERLRLFDLRAVEALLARSRGRRGVKPLREALRAAKPAVAVTRSDVERDFLAACVQAGLRPPSMNLFVAGYEVDAVWMEERLAVELDSRGFHLTRAAFEEDRLRDAALQLAGYRVLRVTHDRFYAEPGAVMETVRSLLAMAPAAPAASSAG